MDDATLTRFMAKVEQTDGCWIWKRPNGVGYGGFSVGGRTVGAHVASYEHFHGPVPPGHEVGHLCHDEDEDCPGGPQCLHRRCVNPDHLQAQTRSENVRGGRAPRTNRARLLSASHCKRGHEFTPENTYAGSSGRVCRRCRRERARGLYRVEG